MSASVKSKDAYEEGVSTPDSDELQLVKSPLSVRDTAVEKREGKNNPKRGRLRAALL